MASTGRPSPATTIVVVVVVSDDGGGVVGTMDLRGTWVDDELEDVSALAVVEAPHPPSNPTSVAARTIAVTYLKDRCMSIRRSSAGLSCTTL